MTLAPSQAPRPSLRWLMSTLIPAALAGCPAVKQSTPPPSVLASSPEEAGEYLVLTGGCNDCHTPGWDGSRGTLPASVWLTGSAVGYRGEWGTSYATNLRLSAQEYTEDAWVQMFRERTTLPPMPWYNYASMNERDLRAIYRFIRKLGPKGEPSREAVPPGKEPSTSYLLFILQQPRGAEPPAQR